MKSNVFIFLVSLLFQPVYANAQVQVLLYNGAGASPTDVVALQDILDSMGVSFETADSYQMNTMSKLKLKSFKAIVWPGGNSIVMGNSLTYAATSAVRDAIVNGGVSYLGICAGAFMAERSSYYYNVFNLAPTWFGFYRPSMIDMVTTYFAGGEQKSLVYWDGPHVSGFGKVIAKYPNGQAAISSARVGKGLVILSGVHPEAPENWRYGFATQDFDGVEADVSYTRELINSALNKITLPAF